MGSVLLPWLIHVVLPLAAMFVCCSGEDSCSDVCGRRDRTLYNMADRVHSIATGNIVENGSQLHQESSSWCPNPGLYKYRTIDGTCNHPTNLGAAFKISSRLLPAAYDDVVNSPRQHGVDGLPLPSARNVSLNLHPPVDAFAKFTIALMNWGQWIDHDIVATADTSDQPGGSSPDPKGALNSSLSSPGLDGQIEARLSEVEDSHKLPTSSEASRRVSCCGPNGGHPPFITDPNCFPIELPANDTAFPGVCLSFFRSLAANDSNNAQLIPRKQINTVTSFIDGSQIYGSSPEVEAQVRVPDSFLLRTRNGNFLPESTTSGCMKRPGSDDYCFLSGDPRVNQNPFIGAMHTIWLREHNRLASELKILKPYALNEEIFQLARKIVIAKNQVITYNTYLPHILGRDAKRWKLVSKTARSIYNQDVDPSILIEFISAAFRFGHSTVPSFVPIGNSVGLLRDFFNRPAAVLNNFDDLVAGMAGLANVRNTNMQTADRNFVEDIARFLFKNQVTGRGLDLVSLNIQRGRDHGIQPYVRWRSFCGLRPLTGFNDTEALGPFASLFGSLYRSVDDIDLYTGMLHEPVDTGLVGPTIRCILRIQFHRLKYGDRFFFNNDEIYSGFTKEQLESLLSVTLSKVVCQNTNIPNMPRDAFKFRSRKNPLLSCSSLKAQDLDLAVFA